MHATISSQVRRNVNVRLLIRLRIPSASKSPDRRPRSRNPRITVAFVVRSAFQSSGFVLHLSFLSPGDDPEKIVKRHIQLLHSYNEAKDATQVCHAA